MQPSTASDEANEMTAWHVVSKLARAGLVQLERTGLEVVPPVCPETSRRFLSKSKKGEK